MCGRFTDQEFLTFQIHCICICTHEGICLTSHIHASEGHYPTHHRLYAQ